ncbi:hypothetical protein ACFYXQ_15720 [Nocardia jiangxiensis]|uniref:Transposase n=1 Tax=Nocardia jiangxiensis TaxID=282685 RepID=A0ABW6S0K4_9NOCA
MPTELAVAELLHARIRALVDENHRLRHRNRTLAIALDDVLDRACAHALCCGNEQLLTATTDRHGSSAVSAGSTVAGDGFAVH